MIQHQGIFLPDGEEHLTEWMTKSGEMVDGRGTYQIKKLRSALTWVKNWRCAVDVGAHAGLWSMQLAKRFERLHAFEPVAAHRECFERNLAACNAVVTMHPVALGDREGSVRIHTAATSSGDSWVDEGTADGPESVINRNLATVKLSEPVPLKRLDDFALPFVDFIKLDCEGYELFALRGAEETLKKCKPCVIVEQKPGRAQKFGLPETQAVDYLRGLGAHLRTAISGDFILSWD